MKAIIKNLQIVDASEWEFAIGKEDFAKLMQAQIYGEQVEILQEACDRYYDIKLQDGTIIDAISDLHLEIVR
ncbi:hypothetical protein [Aeromonas phage phiWae14]|nr:hypothetical protein [Aeromonas phage phiWae14]